MEWRVQLFKLNYDEREIQAVTETLRSGWITMGQRTLDFEAAFAKELGEGAQCLAVANGTAALHMAVLALGVGPGDQVIVPALTFIADINVVAMAGGVPVLADVTSLGDWAMSPGDIERKITPRTKAILIVHYAGYACDMEAITAICKRHSLPLIEDCAHAVGGTYKGRKLGTFGSVAAWSFFTNKNLSVGEGGMVVTRDIALYQKCKNLRSHGMTVASFDRMQGRASTYDVVEPGLNYRIDEMRAALGLVQLGKLGDSNKRRYALTARYFARLDKMPRLSIPFRHFDRGTPTWHIMPVLLDAGVDRQRVIDGLRDKGVQSSVHYPAIQEFTAYRDCLGEVPLAREINRRELTLPLYPTMTDAEVDWVCDALGSVITELGERDERDSLSPNEPN
jgi:dTDP-4-amino-4,6-dideoxygalactose transaminase